MTKKSKSRWLLVATVAAMSVAGFAAVQVMAQDDIADKVDDMLHAMSRPGPEHYRIDALRGEWSTTIKLWANGSDKNPKQYKGSSTRDWWLNGRYLKEENENPAGNTTYRGIGFLGYDRASGLYQNVWMNNQTTDMYMESGRYNPDTKTIHTSGRFVDPTSGIVVLNRTEILIAGPDSHTLTGYSMHNNGREFKAIEVTYTRK